MDVFILSHFKAWQQYRIVRHFFRKGVWLPWCINNCCSRAYAPQHCALAFHTEGYDHNWMRLLGKARQRSYGSRKLP